MSKRIYYTNPKRKKVVQEALLQMRQTRRLIDPELLKHARHIIAQCAEKHDVFESDSFDSNSQQDSGDMVVVDRAKTLQTLMQFLELKPDNKALAKEIENYITSQ